MREEAPPTSGRPPCFPTRATGVYPSHGAGTQGARLTGRTAEKSTSTSAAGARGARACGPGVSSAGAGAAGIKVRGGDLSPPGRTSPPTITVSRCGQPLPPPSRASELSDVSCASPARAAWSRTISARRASPQPGIPVPRGRADTDRLAGDVATFSIRIRDFSRVGPILEQAVGALGSEGTIQGSATASRTRTGSSAWRGREAFANARAAAEELARPGRHAARRRHLIEEIRLPPRRRCDRTRRRQRRGRGDRRTASPRSGAGRG
jgi:hypothetical protein